MVRREAAATSHSLASRVFLAHLTDKVARKGFGVRIYRLPGDPHSRCLARGRAEPAQARGDGPRGSGEAYRRASAPERGSHLRSRGGGSHHAILLFAPGTSRGSESRPSAGGGPRCSFDGGFCSGARTKGGRRCPRRRRARFVPSQMTMIRSDEHTSELQSLMRISYAVF